MDSCKRPAFRLIPREWFQPIRATLTMLDEKVWVSVTPAICRLTYIPVRSVNESVRKYPEYERSKK